MATSVKVSPGIRFLYITANSADRKIRPCTRGSRLRKGCSLRLDREIESSRWDTAGSQHLDTSDADRRDGLTTTRTTWRLAWSFLQHRKLCLNTPSEPVELMVVEEIASVWGRGSGRAGIDFGRLENISHARVRQRGRRFSMGSSR